MKKFWKSLMFAAIGVFALSSCEDVPAPYPNPSIAGGETTAGELLTVDFKSNGKGSWTVTDKVGSSIWSEDAQYGMKASAFKNNTKTAAESWLISPEIDLTQTSDAVLVVKEAINKIDDGKPEELMTVWASADNGETWALLTANARPSGTSWNMQEDKFALNEYDGKIIKVAFKYLSTTESAGTWEIENIKIQGTGTASIEGGTPGPVGPDAPTGDGSAENPYSVTDAMLVFKNGQTPKEVWVKGFIVGYIADKSFDTAVMGGEDATSETNILIAESADETDYKNCIPVQLPAGDVRTGLNLKAHPENYKAEVYLYGNIEKYFTVAGLKTVTKYSIGEAPNDTPDTPTPDASAIDQDFTAGIGKWEIQNVELSGMSFVWQQSAQYGMKASAFVNNANKAAEAWLVSPAFAVTDQTTITINNALNFLKGDALADHIGIYVSTDYTSGNPNDATWTALELITPPDGKSWTFINSTADITPYANKTIHIGFKYVSTTAIAPTWEIKKVSVN